MCASSSICSWHCPNQCCKHPATLLRPICHQSAAFAFSRAYTCVVSTGRPSLHCCVCIFHAVSRSCIYHQGEDLHRGEGEAEWAELGHLCGQLVWLRQGPRAEQTERKTKAFDTLVKHPAGHSLCTAWPEAHAPGSPEWSGPLLLAQLTTAGWLPYHLQKFR